MDLKYSDKKQYIAANHRFEYLSDYYNKRIILLDRSGDIEQIITQLKTISYADNAGKIIVYAREPEISTFEKLGFKQEGIIRGYFRGENAFCYSYFSDSRRSYSSQQAEEERIIEETLSGSYEAISPLEFSDLVIKTASVSDASELAEFLGSNFTTYPTPVHQPTYVKHIIQEKAWFKLAQQHGRIVGAASADRNPELLNAEITDCLIHPDYRGKGLSAYLIYLLEQDLWAAGYISLYSLARAISPAINRALRKNSFDYGGRLINNCCIMGNIEDMNIWTKLPS